MTDSKKTPNKSGPTELTENELDQVRRGITPPASRHHSRQSRKVIGARAETSGQGTASTNSSNVDVFEHIAIDGEPVPLP